MMPTTFPTGWPPPAGNFTQTFLFPIVVLLILLTPLTGQAVLWTGLLLAGLLVVKLTNRYRTNA